MKIILFTILFVSGLKATFAQPAPNVKANTQNFESIKVPQFADAAIKTFFSSYLLNLGNYLKVVRQNNKPQIKSEFDRNVIYGEQIYKQLERAGTVGSEEHKKALDFLKQLRPFQKEISQHSYVKELSAQYLKKAYPNK